MNPSPAAYKDSDMLVELYFATEKLKALSGTEDLCWVTSLEMCVDTRESTLGNFGAYLPKLVQLKINNSMITSVGYRKPVFANEERGPNECSKRLMVHFHT
ncbi:leucine-rich repeat-containing protein 56-like isoform 1-T1 [Salvelinus alpinus]